MHFILIWTQKDGSGGLISKKASLQRTIAFSMVAKIPDVFIYNFRQYCINSYN
jgi:hypothetical protein